MEPLNSGIHLVRHENGTILVDGDSAGDLELALASTSLAQESEQLAVELEDLDVVEA